MASIEEIALWQARMASKFSLDMASIEKTDRWQAKKALKISSGTRAIFSLKGPLSEKRVKRKGRFLRRDTPLSIKASMHWDGGLCENFCTSASLCMLVHVEEVDDDELLPGLIDINAAAEPA